MTQIENNSLNMSQIELNRIEQKKTLSLILSETVSPMESGKLIWNQKKTLGQIELETKGQIN